MPALALKPATYDDLLSLPPNRVGQIVNGRLYSQPRPAFKHAKSGSVLGFELGPPFQRGRGGPGGWWILDEPELHLDAHVLVPDLAGWRRERLPQLPDVAWLDLAPDWVCEILSPSTMRLDRSEKMPIYAACGVSHLWLVDPSAQTLEAYALSGGQWMLLGTFAGEAVVQVPPFHAIELELAGLWL